MTDINGKSTYIEATTEQINIIFLQQDNIILDFVDNELNLNFQTYRNSGIDFTNNIYKNDTNKIIFNLNLYYQWVNAEYPPRMIFIIEKNDIPYITTNISVDDTLDINNLSINIIIDLKRYDKLRFLLKKEDNDINKIKILSNSNYNLKTF